MITAKLSKPYRILTARFFGGGNMAIIFPVTGRQRFRLTRAGVALPYADRPQQVSNPWKLPAEDAARGSDD